MNIPRGALSSRQFRCENNNKQDEEKANFHLYVHLALFNYFALKL